ncbi:glutamine amidotransferase, partial [Streptococcus suis]
MTEKDYTYYLHIGHLYLDVRKTFVYICNILMLKYLAEKLGARVQVDIFYLTDEFDKNFYDIAFFCGGQYYEQSILA